MSSSYFNSDGFQKCLCDNSISSGIPKPSFLLCGQRVPYSAEDTSNTVCSLQMLSAMAGNYAGSDSGSLPALRLGKNPWDSTAVVKASQAGDLPLLRKVDRTQLCQYITSMLAKL